ncbi:MAG: hypothetical protein ACP5FK_11870 [bacterium]
MKHKHHYKSLTTSKETRVRQQSKKIAKRFKDYSDFIFWWF